MNPIDWYHAVLAFIETGGDVLIAIFAVTMLMWTLMLERLVYLTVGHPRYQSDVLAQWQKRRDHASWAARKVKRMLANQLALELNRGMPTIKTLVAICPLLGLLGTVTGMIEVFEVMSLEGNSNPRALASGVSKATIPTMAGLLAALSGLAFSTPLRRYAIKLEQHSETLLEESSAGEATP